MATLPQFGEPSYGNLDVTRQQQELLDNSGIAAPQFQNNTTYAGGDMFGAVSFANEQTASVDAFHNQTLQDQYMQKLAGLAKNSGDKTLFEKLGGQVDPNDPWGFYRESFTNKLASFANQPDPTALYKNKLSSMINGKFSPDDPSYQWRFQQGQQAVERSSAARGLLGSGNAAIELQQYGQGAASTEYAAQFQRTLQGLDEVNKTYNDSFTRLSALAGINLDPSATGRLNNQTLGIGVQAQGQQLDYRAKLAGLAQEQSQFDTKLNLFGDYQQGVAQSLTNYSTPAPGSSTIHPGNPAYTSADDARY